MDNKNVFIAIALSMSVLLFWGAFFETPAPVEKDQIKQNLQRKIENNNSLTPDINETLKIKSLSREDSVNKVKRIKIENNSVIGSISLEGALIDDISFKKHKTNLEDNKNVVFLNPKNTENGFFVETGWSSIGNKIKVPSSNSLWTNVGNKILDQNNSITLEWNNKEGIIFKKIISLDDNYLFKISQVVKNNTKNPIDLYPYAQITRNKVPDDIQNFYISHEGFIGVFDDELKEDDYDDIEDKKM